MERRFRIFRYIIYSTELLVLFVIQGIPNFIPELFGGKPSLIIPVALTISMFEPKLTALWFGLAGGLLTDISNGGVIGFFAIIMTVCCYFISYLTNELIRTRLSVAMVISFIVVAMALSLHFLFFYVMCGYGNNGYFFVSHYLSRILYTIALTPIAYYVNKVLALRVSL